MDVDGNLSRVGNNQKNGYVMQINKFDSSMNVNEWHKDFGLFLQGNEIDKNQIHILLSRLSPESLTIVRYMMALSVEVINVYVKEHFIEGLCNQYVKLRVIENLPVLGDLTLLGTSSKQTHCFEHGQLPMNVMYMWMPDVSSKSFSSPNSVVESQVPKQRTVQIAENSVSPMSVSSPMVANTPK